jgi:hypothetical protein
VLWILHFGWLVDGSGEVGFKAILDQQAARARKRGFEFNLLVAGRSGLGKSTLVDTLFRGAISRRSATASALASTPPPTATSSALGIQTARSASAGLGASSFGTPDASAAAHAQPSEGVTIGSNRRLDVDAVGVGGEYNGDVGDGRTGGVGDGRTGGVGDGRTGGVGTFSDSIYAAKAVDVANLSGDGAAVGATASEASNTSVESKSGLGGTNSVQSTSLPSLPQTKHVVTTTHVVEEDSVKLKLSITETPGFGDMVDNTRCTEPIVEYVFHIGEALR